MSRFGRTKLWAGAALITIGFAVGLLFTSQFDVQFHWRGSPNSPTAQTKTEIQEGIMQASRTFTEVAKRVSPSVVTVSSARVFRLSQQRPQQRQLPDGPMDPFDFFHRFFPNGPGGEDGEQRMQGLGSGVIVSDEGYVLTNNHVIANADEIEVVFDDGRRIDAKLVGTDPKTDIAVIKIDANGLPAAEMGDSGQLEVGEWVLAIGNPFSENLSHTVTAGIISAVGRSYVGLTDYEDYIQTDAAINPGNSGGALVDVQGRVIGINTAIATRSGGSQGVGFAIPINMAREVMDALIRDGKVVRGWLGVQIQNLNEDLAQAKGLEMNDGVLIADVLDDGPAEKVGLERGDVIKEYNGQETKNTAQLRNMVARSKPGTKIDLTVLRDGKTKKMSITLGELPDDEALAPKVAGEPSVEKLGLEVTSITPEIQERLGLDREKGLVITDVRAGSVAARQGMRDGDVILEIDNEPVSSLREYRTRLESADESETVLFLVEREGTTHFVALKVPAESEEEE